MELYESWFSELVGTSFTISRGTRRHRKFIDVEIISFEYDYWNAIDENGHEIKLYWNDIVAKVLE